jgi:hypothetical protein
MVVDILNSYVAMKTPRSSPLARDASPLGTLLYNGTGHYQGKTHPFPTTTLNPLRSIAAS